MTSEQDIGTVIKSLEICVDELQHLPEDEDKIGELHGRYRQQILRLFDALDTWNMNWESPITGNDYLSEEDREIVLHAQELKQTANEVLASLNERLSKRFKKPEEEEEQAKEKKLCRIVTIQSSPQPEAVCKTLFAVLHAMSFTGMSFSKNVALDKLAEVIGLLLSIDEKTAADIRLHRCYGQSTVGEFERLYSLKKQAESVSQSDDRERWYDFGKMLIPLWNFPVDGK